jgi:hypothetical protein
VLAALSVRWIDLNVEANELARPYRARGMAAEEATAVAAERLEDPHEKPVVTSPEHDKHEASSPSDTAQRP